MKEEDLTALVRLFIFFVYLFCLLIGCQSGKVPPQNGAATRVIVAIQQSFFYKLSANESVKF